MSTRACSWSSALGLGMLVLLQSLPAGAMGSSSPTQPAGDPVPITLLHTNDLHSHFRPDRGPLGLGGIARLKTAIDKLRAEIPNTFLVDGGDWSEGNIYYNEGAGIEDLKMLDRLGYDVAVIGNHDWLNGPDILLNILEEVQPKTAFVSANLSTEKYERNNEFQKWITPYVIRELHGVKIAFIGLSTYELIFDKYFAPIKIREPFLVARELAAELKKQVDAVVVISHNSILANKGILKAAPAVDLIIGAHDHVKLTEPVVVSRSGANPGWIVETGYWGQFLGRVDMTVSHGGGVSLNHYELIQMDSAVPEDPQVMSEVELIESKLENRYGPIFHDHVGSSELEMTRTGLENDMGNLTTDAYLGATQADFALDSSRFINGVIHEGSLRTVDIYNSNPAVYNPATQKAWTLKTMPFKGKTLKWLFTMAFGTKALSSYGILSTSGLSFTYDPLFLRNTPASSTVPDLSKPFSTLGLNFMKETEDRFPVVNDIQVHGVPLDDDKVYRVAVGQGLVEAVQFLDSYWNLIPVDGLEDLGIEGWRVMADYIQTHSPLDRTQLPIGNRIRSLQADLGILYDAIKWHVLGRSRTDLFANVEIRVKNFGASASAAGTSQNGPQLHILSNENGTDYSKSPQYQDLGDAQPIPSLQPGESQAFNWQVKIPMNSKLYAVTARVEGVQSQAETSHEEVTRWFTVDR